MNTKLYEKANEIIKALAHASFGVIDENSYPSVSAVALINPESISELYFTTTLDSNKANRLQKNNKASVNCCTSTSNITLVGEAKIFSDEQAKRKHWQGWIDAGADVYPGGVTDPNYCFIKFTTKRVSLWIAEEGEAEFKLDD